VGLIDETSYGEIVTSVREFLDGHPQAVRQRLEREMERSAESMAFERAAELRDLVRAIDRLAERQEVVRLEGSDEDYVHLARQGRTAAVALLQVRSGTLVGRETYFLTADPETPDAEVLGSFLGQYYPMAASWPYEVVVPTDAFESAETIRALFHSGPRGVVKGPGTTRRKTHLVTAQRGARARLLALAQENAAWAVREEVLKEETDMGRTPLEELRAALGLERTPWRIEGYDISNFQGTDSVSSMVVFEGGRAQKSEYRHFRIRTVVGANDFASHAETIRRRFERARTEQSAVALGELSPEKARFARMPDLLLIDGGKGQLSAVRAVLHEMGLQDIPTFGLAKREELLFEEGRPDPIRLPRSSPALRLLQAVRDESHRFAITYHRTLRTKRTLTSELLAVPGIGPSRAKRLLRTFGSLERVAQASGDDLKAAGLPAPVIERLRLALADRATSGHDRVEDGRRGAHGT
jgi:excinuclease ABC subunit C